MISAASFHLTGAPALLIILVVLALIVVGIAAVVRAAGRKARAIGRDEKIAEEPAPGRRASR